MWYLRSSTRRDTWGGLLALGLACIGCWFSGCGVRTPQGSPTSVTLSDTNTAAAITTDEARIRQFCGNCHAFPAAESFPRDQWYEEVRRGFDFYYQSGRTDLQPPAQVEVTAYFQQRAPEHLRWDPSAFRATPSPVRFQRRVVGAIGKTARLPAVSYLAFRPEASRPGLWVSDMRHGEVTLLTGPDWNVSRRITIAQNPVTVWFCDLDGNGRGDLVLADLGSFLPEDHSRGQLVWLPDGEVESDVKPVPLLQGVGRVADVRAADFDGDGDSDLVVAEFGWHRTGGMHLLWNPGHAEALSPMAWRVERVDSRPGAIHVPAVDLNGDGRIDFVALISQEHETVVAFLNRPSGFEQVVLYAAPDPSYGSSGIELCDLDGDGDLDLLYTNGDTFDSLLLKPYHAIRWLVNEGSYPFRERLLTIMPGVHRALAADLDGDGDFDVAACALVPHKQLQTATAAVLEGVIWLEQIRPGEFERHTLSAGPPVHAAMAVVDFDADDDHDLLVGGFYEGAGEETPAVILFENQGSSVDTSERR